MHTERTSNGNVAQTYVHFSSPLYKQIVQCKPKRYGASGRPSAIATSICSPSCRSWHARSTSVSLTKSIVFVNWIVYIFYLEMRDDIDFNVKFCELVETFLCLYDYSPSDYWYAKYAGPCVTIRNLGCPKLAISD